MNNQERMIAPCGIDCAVCDIRLATNNLQLAMDIVEWFKHERKEDIPPEKICCDGCKGDRKNHWSADCWILKCCIDDKGLAFCSECTGFPCDKLVEWSKGNDGYARALERLKEMKG